MKKTLINLYKITRILLPATVLALCFTSCTTDDVELIEDEPSGGTSGLVTFDFTSSAELTGLGVAIPGNGSGTSIVSLTKEKATISTTNAEGANPARIWATNSGVLDFRIYKGDALTFSVPEGYVIKQLSWTSANAETIDSWTANAGSVSNGVWTAPEGKTYQSITLTATATTRMNVLTFGYETGTPNAKADDSPVTPSQPEDNQPVTVNLDFTSAETLGTMGIAVPANGEGSPLSSPITTSKFTLTPTNAEGVNPIRVWATNSGVLDLRAYTGDAITYSVPDDYYITALSWTSANMENIDKWTPSAGTIASGVWTAPDGEKLSAITFTATGTTRINVITATYEKK